MGVYTFVKTHWAEHFKWVRFLFISSTSLVVQTVKCLPTMRETHVRSLGREDPLEKKIAAHSSTLAWKNPTDRGAWYATVYGLTESNRTERLHFHFSLSCIGEGNGNPLQCSCLENPRDGGAWWAAVYGVTQSRTRLKWLSSSSSTDSSYCVYWYNI